MLTVQILHLLYELLWKHADLEGRSTCQLSCRNATFYSTQLTTNHGDDLSLEYLWNKDEKGSLESSLKAMEKNAEHGGQPEILAQVHAIERPITVHCEDSDKGTVFGESSTDCS